MIDIYYRMLEYSDDYYSIKVDYTKSSDVRLNLEEISSNIAKDFCMKNVDWEIQWPNTVTIYLHPEGKVIGSFLVSLNSKHTFSIKKVSSIKDKYFLKKMIISYLILFFSYICFFIDNTIGGHILFASSTIVLILSNIDKYHLYFKKIKGE